MCRYCAWAVLDVGDNLLTTTLVVVDIKTFLPWFVK